MIGEKSFMQGRDVVGNGQVSRSEDLGSDYVLVNSMSQKK